MKTRLLAKGASFLSLLVCVTRGQVCPESRAMRCVSTNGNTPTLDGDVSDWGDVESIQTDLRSIFGTTYDSGGPATFKCLYDTEKIYFALEIPGDYRFDTDDNHLCAAIGTMFKIGPSATFINMGGCNQVFSGCATAVPAVCEDHKVDLGAHWELRTTQQRVLYTMNDGSGNDEVGNKDDEYSVSPYCRFDDDDSQAANEWEGAWSHTDSQTGAPGSYIFELSRTLTTASLLTDAQLAIGSTYSFGIAFWDPYEREDGGWTDAGHYMTGCGSEWIDLTLDATAARQLPPPSDQSFVTPNIPPVSVTIDTPPTTDVTFLPPIVSPVSTPIATPLASPPLQGTCAVPESLVCDPTTLVPVLDGQLNEWQSVPGLESEIHSIFGGTYDVGAVSYKCQYDAEKIYFALEVPGLYRFNTTDNHFCAAIGTMFKLGSRASFVNMGGCPDAFAGCPDGVPSACEDYRVDLGAHWELRTTQQGILYPMNANTGSGNDLVANNDDEYGVSSFCRFDDDDSLAGNEWEGAWSHSNSVDGELGLYRFEIARTLTTASTATDTQLAAGETYSFGIAYWDPYETEEGGWSDAGHFLTGCAANWIDLVLGGDPSEASSSSTSGRDGTVDPAPVAQTTSCSAISSLTCDPMEETPNLDGALDEWESVQGISTDLMSIFGTSYEIGAASYKCQYDSEKIYFALEIPGLYRFNETDNHFCAAIGTMFKIGSRATYVNMGGCPDALVGCPDGVPPECEDYLVDLGAHWELRTTQQGVLYPINANTGSGNDLVANNDDEYSVSSFCRFDDDDSLAGNEWEGAWSHSNSIDGELGFYRFEIARTLTTASTVTDKQLAAGETYSFGLAYWDPYETEESGWSDAGHFVTGCAANWIDLVLGDDPSEASSSSTSGRDGAIDSTPVAQTTSCSAATALTCEPTGETPNLDGALDEWESIPGLATDLMSIFGTSYEIGAASYKCQYDSEKIYFALEIPGLYRFNETDNHFCAAIGTMFKLGSRAAYVNMGGCPDALAGCPDGVPPDCEDYMVDLGAHWELRTTQQGVLYPMNANTGSGNDLVANNDDEYSVSSFCRFDDDDSLAGNEWEGAWSHSNSIDGELGFYRFEIARTLTTASNVTDAQLAAGETYSFGLAYWDPYETEESGWSDAGHFVTGCAANWIDLVLGGVPSESSSTSDRDGTVDSTPVAQTTSCSAATALTCEPTGETPNLDGALDEWDSVPGLATDLMSIFGTTYEMGAASYKCQYDSEKIYFALEIPGSFRFDETDNHFCAAIGTMFKIGSRAAYVNMGGCPDALAGCPDGVPPECEDYLVDLGAHWELRTTQQGVLYPMNNSTGSGNDLVANNDDEYGVSPFCRFDDDDSLAANDWEGAWSHTNPIEGEEGVYQFEIARVLRTASTYSDSQYTAGSTYSFGIAYWDPYETEEDGWSDAGHFLTGCASNWIDLTLGPGTTDIGASSIQYPPLEEDTSLTPGSGSSTWSFAGTWLCIFLLWGSLAQTS